MNEPTRNFTRRIEDFSCGHCGALITGNGYTNHCPKCLYSKHVDVMPGDRQSTCGGLMAPIRVELFEGSFKILHRCLRCNHEKKNRTVPEDDFDALLRVTEKETKTNIH